MRSSVGLSTSTSIDAVSDPQEATMLNAYHSQYPVITQSYEQNLQKHQNHTGP